MIRDKPPESLTGKCSLLFLQERKRLVEPVSALRQKQKRQCNRYSLSTSYVPSAIGFRCCEINSLILNVIRFNFYIVYFPLGRVGWCFCKLFKLYALFKPTNIIFFILTNKICIIFLWHFTVCRVLPHWLSDRTISFIVGKYRVIVKKMDSVDRL